MMACELYLIRHGVAEERGERWPDDSKRPLSDDGMVRFRKAARGFAQLGTTLDVVLTSPLVRARQTAEIVAQAFAARPPVVLSDALAPGGTYESLLADIAKQARQDRLALVGHEPGIGQLAARLSGSRRPLEFKKGAICCIDFENFPPVFPGAVRWFVTPRILRCIKK